MKAGDPPSAKDDVKDLLDPHRKYKALKSLKKSMIVMKFSPDKHTEWLKTQNEDKAIGKVSKRLNGKLS